MNLGSLTEAVDSINQELPEKNMEEYCFVKVVDSTFKSLLNAQSQICVQIYLGLPNLEHIGNDAIVVSCYFYIPLLSLCALLLTILLFINVKGGKERFSKMTSVLEKSQLKLSKSTKKKMNTSARLF